MSQPRYWAVLPAAGTGSRFGGDTPKQWLPLLGKPLMVWTIDTLCQLPLAGCVIAIHPDDQQSAQFDYAAAVPLYWTPGGNERAQSVLAGLDFLADHADAADWVLVHDIARPCITQAAVIRLMQAVADEPAGGILAIPVCDTLKRGHPAGHIDGTIDRTDLWQAQTPQLFRYGLLRRALRDSLARHGSITDEASAVEAAGHTVKLVPGSVDNLKVTYPDDLLLAAAILQHRLQGDIT